MEMVLIVVESANRTVGDWVHGQSNCGCTIAFGSASSGLLGVAIARAVQQHLPFDRAESEQPQLLQQAAFFCVTTGRVALFASFATGIERYDNAGKLISAKKASNTPITAQNQTRSIRSDRKGDRSGCRTGGRDDMAGRRAGTTSWCIKILRSYVLVRKSCLDNAVSPSVINGCLDQPSKCVRKRFNAVFAARLVAIPGSPIR